MEPKMTILFIGKKTRTTRHQLLPIYLRVTIEGKRFEVATHRYALNPQLCSEKKLLPVPTNQKVNAYLKELADICGIQTKITFHIARHTFASTVTLDIGVPIDSVSKMLGHRSIKTKQIYAKVSSKKISDDTQYLFQKLLNK